jgi:predicted phosphodiesterase
MMTVRVLGRARAPFRHPTAMRLLVLVVFLWTVSRVVAPTTFRLDAGDLTIDLTPSVPGGKLRLELGPFGRLTWSTHKGPLDIDTTFVLAKRAEGVPELADAADLRWKLLGAKAPWLVVSGLLLGLALAGNPANPGWRPPVFGAAGMVGTATTLVLVSVLTFNANALKHPRYEGPITDAPRVIALLKEAQGDLAGVTRNINKTIAGLERIHRQIVERAAAPPEDTIKFLVISDIHNNPLGLLIAQELADQFGIDAIIDAGDFTDRGSAPEATLFTRFATFSVPHVIVGGNHEDTAVMRSVRRLSGVTVLDATTDTDVIAVDDITILGDSDPNSRTVSSDPFNDLAAEQIPLRCAKLAERTLEVRPQIVVVHDPRQGECAASLAESNDIPLVFVWGHTHRQAYEERGSVIGVSDGTSGANGIKTGKPAPYGFALLEFDRATDVLSSVCLFQFDGPSALRQTSCHIATAGQSSRRTQ